MKRLRMALVSAIDQFGLAWAGAPVLYRIRRPRHWMYAAADRLYVEEDE